jgi:serine/threonine-protein kinase
MNLEVGSTVGDYQVVGVLGAGGMGKVYKVRNVISDRVEAMKILLPDLAHEPELADRFLREIKVQASLEHPNIAALHTAVRVNNQLLMLMEFVEGVTLEQRAKNGPLPAADAVAYIRQVLAALEYAHARGVIHRDIKPANMMLTSGGIVKLMDFGIAKAATDRRLTMTGTTMGSLYYMSPEQIQGVATLDGRADLYSVGVSLYELATGKRPFDGDSHYSIMAAHLEKSPVPPIQIDPKLPPMLNDIILMSVAKDPNARFQTAAAFGNALSNVAVAPAAPAQAAAEAVPAVAPAAARPRSKRGLWMVAAAAAAVLAVVAFVEFGPPSSGNAAPKTQDPDAVTRQSQTPPAPVTPTAVTEAQPAATESQPAPAQPKQAPAAKPPRESPRPDSSATVPAKPEESKAAAPSPPEPQVRVPEPPPTAPVKQQAAPPVNRAQLQEIREQLMMLNTRAAGIRTSLGSLQRSQAAKGLNLSSTFQEPATMMDSYLEGATAALNAGDAAAAKGFMDKAERQVERLEKLLNR